ncbi:uncharacterized protein L201_000458 [Kwoniella dendrophila CBS 6074]|uniref:Thioredoxin domain-containing protein n=1 Tax=Kwoniella dendrophila CBS 6074 TaxID=1295534 RepID=A0AAX4JL41_9TREE
MAPLIPKRPAHSRQGSSNTSQSSSFRSLFTQPNSKLSNEPMMQENEVVQKINNRILPVSDFPPQAERRRSSAADFEIGTEEGGTISSPIVPDSPNIPQQHNNKNVPFQIINKHIGSPERSSSTKSTSHSPSHSRSSTINHKRSHSLRRKPVPTLLLNETDNNQSLPVDHPFAASNLRTSTHSKNGSGSASSSLRSCSPTGGRNTPTPTDRYTPVMMNNPPIPDRSMGRTPPPPARKGIISPKKDENAIGPNVSKKKNSRPDTAGTFGGRRSVDESRPTTAAEGSSNLSKGRLQRLDIPTITKEDALNARLISLSLDRPLPPTPSETNKQLDQDPSAASSSSSSSSAKIHSPIARRAPIRSSVDTNGSSSRSMDLFAMLRSGPSRRSQSRSQANSPISPTSPPGIGSIPMKSSSSNRHKSGSGSGLGTQGTHTGSGRYKSKVFRWDSTEKIKKPITPPTTDSDKGSSEEDEFSIDKLPSKKNLWEAGTCFLKDENGDLKCFGDFFPKYHNDPSSSFTDDQQSQTQGKGKSRENLGMGVSTTMEKSATYSTPESKSDTKIRKTVIFFIRHFWCGQCQDYTFASLSLLDPVALEKAGIRVIIISNGSWKIIKAYKKLFNCPFPIYVDGPRRLYQLMGMTKMTNDFGPLFKGRAAYHQRAVPGQLLHGLGNAFFRMPLANPGTLTQLGGEFILTPGWNCEFAHRMTTTSDHMEAPDVLRLAGCANPTKSDVVELELADSQRAELERLEKEMKEWQENRTAELERIRQKKAARRGVNHEHKYEPQHERRDSEFTIQLNGVEDTPESGFEEEVTQALQAPIELVNHLDVSELQDSSKIDAKTFQDIIQEQEMKEKEKLAAGELMLARGKGDLEIQLESVNRSGKI